MSISGIKSDVYRRERHEEMSLEKMKNQHNRQAYEEQKSEKQSRLPCSK